MKQQSDPNDAPCHTSTTGDTIGPGRDQTISPTQ